MKDQKTESDLTKSQVRNQAENQDRKGQTANTKINTTHQGQQQDR